VSIHNLVCLLPATIFELTPPSPDLCGPLLNIYLSFTTLEFQRRLHPLTPGILSRGPVPLPILYLDCLHVHHKYLNLALASERLRDTVADALELRVDVAPGVHEFLELGYKRMEGFFVDEETPELWPRMSELIERADGTHPILAGPS